MLCGAGLSLNFKINDYVYGINEALGVYIYKQQAKLNLWAELSVSGEAVDLVILLLENLSPKMAFMDMIE